MTTTVFIRVHPWFHYSVPTIREQLKHWREAFKRTGIDEPRLNAELLVAHVLVVDRGALMTCVDDELSPRQLAQLRELAQRRLRREPIDFILGRRNFYGRDFIVREGVLVPRPETETIVEICKRDLPADLSGWAMDVGCGSGCLVVTLALEFPLLDWIAIDINPTALKITRENAERFGVSRRVHLLRGDGLQAVKAAHGLTLAVSNPPYIDPDDAGTLQPEVIDYEPHEALFGGPGGVAVSHRFLAELPERLKPGSAAFFEFGAGQEEAMARAAIAAGLNDVRTHADFAGIERILECHG